MKKLLTPISYYIYQDAIASIRIYLSFINISDWIIELLLVEKKIIPHMTILSEDKKLVLEISILNEKNRAIVKWIDEKNIEVGLSENNLEYLLFYFLRAYRDEEFEVDHIDIECEVINNASQKIDLTMRVDKYRKPMTKEELIMYLSKEGKNK